MKVTISGRITKNESGGYQAPIIIGEGLCSRVIQLDLEPDFNPGSSEVIRPFGLDELPADGWWIYRGTVVSVEGSKGLSLEEIKLKVKHKVLRHDKTFARMRREVEALENVEKVDVAVRERISDSVRLFVWQRDQGKCVKCGSKEKLEFDHIIPVIKGGSNRERNIQLLCEPCNRSKGSDI